MKTLLLKGLVLLLSATVAYLLGGCNGAILVSRRFFHEDVRKNGSGNAGLTNFYRVYGAKYLPLVVLIDVGKTVLSVYAATYLFEKLGFPALYAKYWAGLWVCIGHAFPFAFGFRGGKGILCAGTLLWLLDWRIAAVAFVVFVLGVALSGYISVGSILACVSFPIMTAIIFPDQPFALFYSCAIAALAIAAHHGNIRRLINGTESRFRFRKNTQKEKCK